jgi:hypothetical protein
MWLSAGAIRQPLEKPGMIFSELLSDKLSDQNQESGFRSETRPQDAA